MLSRIAIKSNVAARPPTANAQDEEFLSASRIDQSIFSVLPSRHA
jgi:hypothetical protein